MASSNTSARAIVPVQRPFRATAPCPTIDGDGAAEIGEGVAGVAEPAPDRGAGREETRPGWIEADRTIEIVSAWASPRVYSRCVLPRRQYALAMVGASANARSKSAEARAYSSAQAHRDRRGSSSTAARSGPDSPPLDQLGAGRQRPDHGPRQSPAHRSWRPSISLGAAVTAGLAQVFSRGCGIGRCCRFRRSGRWRS